MVAWRQSTAHHQEAGDDGLLMLSQEGDWTHQGASAATLVRC